MKIAVIIASAVLFALCLVLIFIISARLKAGKERYAKGVLAKKVLIICALFLAINLCMVFFWVLAF